MNTVVIKPSVERDVAVDVLKTVAIVSVLTIHASTGGYGSPIMSFDWWASLFWGCLTRAAVPLFLMCSGALMLHPAHKVTVKRLYTHNVWRLFVAMVAWALFYKCYHLIETDALSTANLGQAVREVLFFNQEFHLYYIHIMFLVYAFVPVMRLLTEKASKRQMQYFLLLWFALGIVYPTACHYWPLRLMQGVAQQYGMNMTYAAIGYGVAGYYLRKYPLSRRCCVALMGVGFAMTYGLTTLLTITHDKMYTVFLGGMSPGVCLLGMGIFGLLGQLHYAKPVSSIALRISKASFCIYLVHVWFNCMFSNHGLTVAVLPCAVSIPLLVCLNMLLSYAVYLVLSRIPVVNRYLI